MRQDFSKYTEGFMVAGGLSEYGPGKLIFCVGTMDSKCYARTLDYFKEDIDRLNEKQKEDITIPLNKKGLYFQQDGAPCHTSAESMKLINTYLFHFFLI